MINYYIFPACLDLFSFHPQWCMLHSDTQLQLMFPACLHLSSFHPQHYDAFQAHAAMHLHYWALRSGNSLVHASVHYHACQTRLLHVVTKFWLVDAQELLWPAHACQFDWQCKIDISPSKMPFSDFYLELELEQCCENFTASWLGRHFKMGTPYTYILLKHEYQISP